MIRNFKAWGAVAAILLLAGLVFAAGRSQVVQPQAVAKGVKTSTESGLYRAQLGIADIATSTDLENSTMLAAIPAVDCGGFERVAVQGLFTNSGATCVVHCVRYRGSEFRGRTTVTLTAATTTPTVLGSRATTLYPSELAEFNTAGADKVRFLRAAPSAGDCALQAEVY